MIEPHHAERLGFCVAFPSSSREQLEATVLRLQALGVRRVRVKLSAENIADTGWLAWSFDRLGREFDLLPSIEATADILANGGALTRLLDLGGAHFQAVELLDRPGARQQVQVSTLLTAAEFVRGRSCRAVIGLDAARCSERIGAYGCLGLLNVVSAVGLHSLCADGRPALDDMLYAAREAARQYNPKLEIWLTAIGRSTWRHELSCQAQIFCEALMSAAERVYWHALADDATFDARDREAHFGLDAAEGPKLLGRLLEGGVAEVESLLDLAGVQPAPALTGLKPVLVTGGAGFIGANLADRLAADGHHVQLFDALARPGVERNLRWLTRRHPSRVSFVLGDLRDEAAASQAASRASAVFHLAGQVAVTTSMVHPLADFEVNARGTLALLEAVRRYNPAAPFIFASTNKVYGELTDIALARDGDCYVPQRADYRTRGVSEARPLCFHTPYGCSKGTADQYVLDYAHSFGLRTAVLRMSCIYGERQLGTEDQGWVAHFLLRAIAGEQVTIYGDGRQVRDILHVGDAVAAYVAAWQNIDSVAGRAYNLGGGPANAVSLLQLIEHIEMLLGRRLDVEFSAWRPGDQRYFVADTDAIRRDLDLPAALGWRAGIARLAAHFGAMVEIPAQVSEAAL